MQCQPDLPSKEEALDVFHFYKDRLRMGQQSSLARGHDFSTIYAVLANHPKAAQKIGCGVADIFVRRSFVDGEEVCCCYVKRVDGSEEDFSVFKPYGRRSWKNTGNHVVGNRILPRYGGW